jgi:hypothetical protein
VVNSGHDAQVRDEGGERVIRDLGTRGGDRGDRRGRPCCSGAARVAVVEPVDVEEQDQRIGAYQVRHQRREPVVVAEADPAHYVVGGQQDLPDTQPGRLAAAHHRLDRAESSASHALICDLIGEVGQINQSTERASCTASGHKRHNPPGEVGQTRS